MNTAEYKVLSKIYAPADLKNLSLKNLLKLACELRNFIIDCASRTGGHFSANLGVVELSIAIHYVFNTPYDRVIWDVGHQAYPHKILTGRRCSFDTNRVYGGISGFPKITESEYDAFGTGHSSTSISAALGMATASMLKGESDRKHIAIIGDGALTAGMAFEALNNTGASQADVLVILNDNGISIDPNVGSITNYLTKITTSEPYNKIRSDIEKVLDNMQENDIKIKKFIKFLKKSLKGILLNDSNLFEALNFRYFGPINGHDVGRLIDTLQQLKSVPGPKILHCLTKKGKGFKAAEENQTKWHAPGCFDKTTGLSKSSKEKKEFTKWQDVFGKTLLELAESNNKIIGITPAMITGSAFNFMQEKYPERVIDVGIAEQHAVTFAAGLAKEGMIPFCNIYSSFMQRAYDQVIHDVAIQKLPVIMCLDRAGLVGEDGPTHHGSFDLAYMRIIPNLIIAAPGNEVDLRNLMYTAQAENYGPFVIRYPRGCGKTLDWEKKFQKMEIGRGREMVDGSDLAIISIGHVRDFANEAVKALRVQNINIGHYDLIFLKPLDDELLHNCLRKYKNIITVEDGCLAGGMGSALLEFASEHDYDNKIRRLGIGDEFITHGATERLYEQCKYNCEAIIKQVKQMLGY